MLHLSTCTQKSLSCSALTFPRCIKVRFLGLGREARAWKFNLHSEIDGIPLDGLPRNRWYYNMRTALLTDPAILCLCWECTTSLQRGALSQNCQMATPPFMWKGRWSSPKRQRTQWYILCSAVIKRNPVTLCPSFVLLIIIEYTTWKTHSLNIVTMKETTSMMTVLQHSNFGIHASSRLKNHFAVNHQLEKKGKVKCRMNISGPRCLIALN